MLVRRLAVAIISIFIALLTATSAWGAVLYVKQNSPGPVFDGQSWETAFHKVQDAVDAAAVSDEIWVAAGTYLEHIQINKSLTLYGGFTGSETSADQRDWLRNQTILDGNREAQVIQCYYNGPVQGLIKIDGIRIQNGYSQDGGGGISCNTSYCSVEIVHCTFYNNSSASQGGGIYSRDWIRIADSTFTGNTARDGGGVYSADGVDIASSTFTDNIAGYGGGVCAGDHIKINKCSFKRNRAAIGGAVSSPYLSTYILTNIYASRFSDNSAIGQSTEYGSKPSYGGAIYIKNSQTAPTGTNVINCFFSGNSASDSGSAVYLDNCSGRVVCNSFANNGIADEGVVHLENSDTQFSHNIVAFNTSGVKWNGPKLTYQGNCVYQNTAYDFSGADPTVTGYNISADPKLADILRGDLHIQPDSPCRDAECECTVTVPYTDIDGHVRVIGSRLDIGADESNGIVWIYSQVGVVHVSPNGSDSNDGSSWAMAKKTIQAGIDAASDRVAEVWVAAGTYKERITLKPYAWLYGGFAGTETDRSQRDWKQNRTVIDGSIGQGSTVSIIGIAHDMSCLDGFVVCGGTGTKEKPSDVVSSGGGIYCSASAVNITNNVIRNNKASGYGGGIYCINSSPRIIGNEIGANASIKEDSLICQGGAIWCEGNSPVIANNIIWGNYAYWYGGVVLAGPAKLINNTIVDNMSRVPHNGYKLVSGAVVLLDALPQVANNIIAFNSGGISYEGDETVTVKNNCVYGSFYQDYVGYKLSHDSDINIDPGIYGLDFSNYHLQSSSPCINAGDNASAVIISEDMEGEARVQGDRVDIGADETDGRVWDSKPAVVCVGSVNCGSTGLWQYAKHTIQEAIDALPPGGGEVWVKGGYVYTSQTTIKMRDHVQVLGGFKGDETDKTQRDWSNNAATISNNRSSVITAGMGCVRASVDGFTVTAGTGQPYGGGFLCEGGSALTISHNKISDNRAIQTLIDRGKGGGIYSAQGAYTSILNNLICNNEASFGGGVYTVQTATITGNTIVANLSTDNNGGGIRTGSGNRLYNNIIAFNTGYGMIFDDYPEAKVNYVYGNQPHDAYPGLGSEYIIADPLFKNKEAGDYRLSLVSPCVDNGLDNVIGVLATDLEARDRIFFGRIDCGAYECYDLPASVAEVKMNPPLTRIRFTGTVSAVFGSALFYVESPDRSSGIGCTMTNHGLNVGDIVDIVGKVTITASSEKMLQVSSVVVKGHGSIQPVSMNNRTVGGSNMSFDPLTQSGQAGVTGGVGPNNIGLLVKTTGRVTRAGTTYFYIDDGSGVSNGSQFKGINIITSAGNIPPLNSYVSVTGISVPARSSSSIYRTIKPRDKNDIVIMQQ